MIVLPISLTEVRAMHGADAALPALSVLAVSGMGLSLEHLETGTGYKRHALIKACRLLRHMNLVDFDEPRANSLRNIRMIAAVQLPLPGTHTQTHIPAGPVSPITGGEAVIETQPERGLAPRPPGARAPDARESGARENETRNLNHANLTSVVVGVVNQRVMDLYSQQQQHTHTAPDSREKFRARGLLRALGIWPNVIDSVEEADFADVLGWVAYVSDPANKIGNKPALVLANLKAGRPAAGAYRPFPVCRACHMIETVCECETPDLHWPDEYDLLAFQTPAPGWGETADDWLRRRWYCPECFSFPCRCHDDHEDD